MHEMLMFFFTTFKVKEAILIMDSQEKTILVAEAAKIEAKSQFGISVLMFICLPLIGIAVQVLDFLLKSYVPVPEWILMIFCVISYLAIWFFFLYLCDMGTVKRIQEIRNECN